MHGGPSQVDLLDPKPMLERYDGQAPTPRSPTMNANHRQTCSRPLCFTKHGQSGLEFPKRCRTSPPCDRIAFIRLMFTEHRNHEQPVDDDHRHDRGRRPSIGPGWLTAGTVNRNLPAYVVLPVRAAAGGCIATGQRLMPPLYQGTPFRSEGMRS